MSGIVAVGCGSQPHREPSPSINASAASTQDTPHTVLLHVPAAVPPEPPLSDGLGHYWYDGRWHGADGQPYLPDGLGHFWRYGAWYNSDGTLWLPPPPPPTWQGWALAAGWPEYLLPALGTVMRCESTFNPYARNGQYVGLMQLSPMWFGYAGEDYGSWTDPVVNLRTAWAVYLYDQAVGNRPWHQWQCKA